MLLARPRVAIAAGIALIAVVALADLLTGYEVRLAILYLLPLALVTWVAGRGWGLALAALAAACWLASFGKSHGYSDDVYHYWDGAVMVLTFTIVVLLLARLRTALARSDERFVRVLDSLDAPVYVCEPGAGRILYANRRADENFGDSASSGADLERRLAPGPGPELRDAAAGRWYLRQQRPMIWPDGRRVELNLLTDVTGRVEAETLRRSQEEALARTFRLLSIAETATLIAHELAQPLGAISAYVNGCLRSMRAGTPDPADILDSLEKCGEQSLRAGGILRRVRESVNKPAAQRVPCDLRDIVRDVARLVEPDAARTGASLELDLGALPLRVRADRSVIEQALLNLARNGLDAMARTPVGGRRLRLSAHADADGDAVASTQDAGEGITPEAAERIFTPFYTTRAEGLGLGLAIAYSAAESHGGRLRHRPAAGGGTVFRFSLPMEAG